MPTLAELQSQIVKAQEQARAMMATADTGKKNAEGGAVYNWTAEQLGEFKNRTAEIDDLNVQLSSMQEMERKARDLNNARNRQFDDTPALPVATPGQVKSIGQLFAESPEFKSRRGNRVSVDLPDIDVKTLMQTSAGFAPSSPRTNIVVPYATRRPVVADLIPQDPTTLAAIKYMEETTFTNSADTVAEAAAYPESALAYTERTATVRKIATFLPISDEQLEDVPSMQALLDNRLLLMLALAEETQLLNGDGNAPDVTGFLNHGSLQTQAKGADRVQDAIFKAMTKIRATAYADPSGVILHPNDWQEIRLSTTADGIYFWGAPTETGITRIWGVPVIVTTAATEGPGLVGDFSMYSHISRRMGVSIDVSNSHDDYFVKGKLAVRIQERLSLEIYRGAAFCTVTSI